MLSVSEKDGSSCLTGNPIDDCWKCDPDWPNNRQRLADCVIGFGQYAKGGKGGEFYVVTDSSDDDPVNPKPGTLRYAVIQNEPLWIVFPSNMMIKLSQELIFNSYKTIDGRGADVHIVGGGCITLQYISNVIIHNIHIHHCHPSGKTNHSIVSLTFTHSLSLISCYTKKNAFFYLLVPFRYVSLILKKKETFFCTTINESLCH